MNRKDAEDTETRRANDLTKAIIGAAIEVHNKALGPGLLESAYEECLSHELSIRGIPFERQLELPVEYKGVRLNCGYRLDLLVAGTVVVEIKAVETPLPIRSAQLISYLRLGGWKAGLLISLHVPVLKDGLQRKVLGLGREARSALSASLR